MHVLDAVQIGFGDGEETSLVIEMPLEQALLQLYVRVAIDILRAGLGAADPMLRHVDPYQRQGRCLWRRDTRRREWLGLRQAVVIPARTSRRGSGSLRSW